MQTWRQTLERPSTHPDGYARALHSNTNRRMRSKDRSEESTRTFNLPMREKEATTCPDMQPVASLCTR